METLESKATAESIAQVRILTTLVRQVEDGVREEIREQSQNIVATISKDIQSMWAILHPDEKIEDVRLHIPAEFDKAIDICLKFHGIEQDSPRLTLSEGFRNSLGLCIFLAMASRDAVNDRPLFLDDVVVSLDRNHRGMVAELLDNRFADRQILLFTHDRDWFTELHHMFDDDKWDFKVLLPYETPTVGMRWSAKIGTFDEARALIDDSPDAAANRARAIMDIELALRAERLKLRLPYLHRTKNDHRVAHDFLMRLISDGQDALQRKKGNNYEVFSEAIDAFKEADKLLMSWGNKASHSFDVKKVEAEKLIATCEKALGFLNCPSCKKPIHKLEDQSAKLVRCDCGEVRWRHGKT